MIALVETSQWMPSGFGLAILVVSLAITVAWAWHLLR
jgi:type IV secretory pathway TrbD component